MLKKRAIQIIKMLLVCFILFSLHSRESYAQDKGVGSITLYSHFNADSGSIQIENDYFRVTKIADYVDGHYVNKTQFSFFPLYSEKMNASEKKELAFDLEKYTYKEKIEPDDEKSSDKKGYTVFNNLEKGVYLVTQNRQELSAQKQYITNPFLVSIPMVSDGKLIYDIYAEPKYTDGESEKGEAQKQDKPSLPETSDESDSNFWILLISVSIMVIAALSLSKRKDREL